MRISHDVRLSPRNRVALRHRVRAAALAVRNGGRLADNSNVRHAGVDWDEGFLSGFGMCVASVQTENPNPKHGNLLPALPGFAARRHSARPREARTPIG
jgi:hypothetical protein